MHLLPGIPLGAPRARDPNVSYGLTHFFWNTPFALMTVIRCQRMCVSLQSIAKLDARDAFVSCNVHMLALVNKTRGRLDRVSRQQLHCKLRGNTRMFALIASAKFQWKHVGPQAHHEDLLVDAFLPEHS